MNVIETFKKENYVNTKKRKNLLFEKNAFNYVEKFSNFKNTHLKIP